MKKLGFKIIGSYHDIFVSSYTKGYAIFIIVIEFSSDSKSTRRQREPTSLSTEANTDCQVFL